MLNILACFKIVDETDDLLESDWLSLSAGISDINCVRRVLGCFDEAALESALQLKDAVASSGKNARITAVTISPGYSEHILDNLPAINIDRVVCLECGEDLRFRPESTAQMLADFAETDGPFDILFTGVQTPPGNSGMVPFLLAEVLGVSIASEVIAVLPAEDGFIIEHVVTGGICTRLAHPPFVCAMGSARHSYLRMPTLRDKLRTRGVKPEYRFAEPSPGRVKLFDLCRNADARSCTFIDGESPGEIAAEIYDRFLRRC